MLIIGSPDVVEAFANAGRKKDLSAGFEQIEKLLTKAARAGEVREELFG